LDSVYSLTALNLSHNDIASVTDIVGLANLSSLGLAYTKLSYNDVCGLTYLSQLKEFDISGITVDVSQLPKTMPNLVTLKLADCSISDYTASKGLVSFLKGYPSLQELSIGGNGLTDSNLNDIAQLTNLTSLDLWNSPLTGSQTYNTNKLSALSKLTSLSLKDCNNFTDPTLFDGLTQLSELNVAGCFGLTSMPFLANFTGLKVLHMEYTLNGLDTLTWHEIDTLLGSDPTAPATEIYLFEDNILHSGEYTFYNDYRSFQVDCSHDATNVLTYSGSGVRLILSFAHESFNSDKWWGSGDDVIYPASVLEVNYVNKKGYYADTMTTETKDRATDFTVNFINMSMSWTSDVKSTGFVYYLGGGTLNLGFYGANHSYFSNHRGAPDRPKAANETDGGQGNQGYSAFVSKGKMVCTFGTDTDITGGTGGKGQQGGPLNSGMGRQGTDGGKGGTGGWGLEASEGPVILRQLGSAVAKVIGGPGGEGGEPDAGTLFGSAGSKGASGDQGAASNQEIKTYTIA
jgi:hypothetical protein